MVHAQIINRKKSNQVAKKNIEVVESESFAVLPRMSAPIKAKVVRDPHAARKAMFEGYVTQVRDAGEDSVGRLDLAEDESYRAHLLNLASAAKRQGVAIATWTANEKRTVFFEVA